jgi:hypothetical protein
LERGLQAFTLQKYVLSAWSLTFICLGFSYAACTAAGALVERGLQVLQNYVLSAWSNATSRVAGASSEPLGGHSEQFYLMLYFVSYACGVVVVTVRPKSAGTSGA